MGSECDAFIFPCLAWLLEAGLPENIARYARYARALTLVSQVGVLGFPGKHAVEAQLFSEQRTGRCHCGVFFINQSTFDLIFLHSRRCNCRRLLWYEIESFFCPTTLVDLNNEYRYCKITRIFFKRYSI